jgi:DNA-binding NarL/FixJ family response regulator
MQSVHDAPNVEPPREGPGAQEVPPARAHTTQAPNERFHQHEELLVLGGWKWLEWSAGVRQCVTIVRAPGGAEHRYLTATEFELASAVAVGVTVKRAAADSNIEWATARTALNRALRKLGLRSCAHLPVFWHGLCGTAAHSRMSDGSELLVFESRLDGHPPGISLTSAERDVLQAVLLGRDNQQIARQRHTSVRTVANQLATLFQKFGASSKAELAARALSLIAG